MSIFISSERRTVSLSPPLRASLTRLLADGRRIDAVRLIRRDHKISLQEAVGVVDQVVARRSTGFDLGQRRDNQRSFPALAVAASIFLAVGICLGAVAIWIHHSNSLLLAKGLQVQGEVIGLQSNGRSTAPIVGYMVNDAKYEYRSTNYTNVVDYEIGSRVNLLVDAENPHMPLINDAFHRYAGIVILSFVAAGMLLAFFISLALAVCRP